MGPQVYIRTFFGSIVESYWSFLEKVLYSVSGIGDEDTTKSPGRGIHAVHVWLPAGLSNLNLVEARFTAFGTCVRQVREDFVPDESINCFVRNSTILENQNHLLKPPECRRGGGRTSLFAHRNLHPSEERPDWQNYANFVRIALLYRIRDIDTI